MIVMTNINGFETPIEFPEGSVASVHASGDRQQWRVDFGSGFVQVGGIATVAFDNVTEAAVTVRLPFGKLLDFQATPIDVQGPLGEAVHIELLDNDSVQVYARTSQTFTGSFYVKWSASGVVAL